MAHLKEWIMAALLTGAFATGMAMQGYQHIHYFPALVLLSLGLLLGLTGKSLNIPTSGPAFCLILLWALYAVMFAFSTIPFISQIAFLIFCALPLAFFGTAVNGAGLPLIRPLVILSAFVFAGLSAFAVYKNIFIPTGAFGERAHWPFINPNSLATILNLGLIPLTAIALGTNNRRTRMIFAALALLVYAGLIATVSRGGLLAAFISLGVLFAFNRHRLTIKSFAPVAAAGLAISILLPILSGSHLWRDVGHLVSMAPGNPSIVDRLSLWQSTWRMMMDHLWTGTGPGTFSAYYPAYREPMVDQSAGHFAHFDPLQMGAEMGIGALILSYALMLAILIRTIRAMLATRDDLLRLRIIAPFAALLAVAIHAHICFPLYLMPVLLACGVLLAIWHRATTEALPDGDTVLAFPSLIYRAGIGFAGLSLTALLLTLAGSTAAGSFYMQKALHEKDTQSYLVTLSKADRLGPESFIDPEIEMARINLRLLQGGEIKSVALQQRFLDETGILLDSALSWNPAWAETDYLRGQYLKLENRNSDAVTAWESALKKNPMHFDTRRALAEHFKTTGNLDAAIPVVADGLNYPHPLAYRNWASAFLQGVRQ
ncbi:MAG: O-antigen ligase family protein [Micavibrio sp.]